MIVPGWRVRLMLISKVEADLEVCMGNLSSFVDWRAFTHDKTFEGRFTIIPSPPKNSIQNHSLLTTTCDTYHSI
jgi:hypothetical protein